MIRHVVLLEFTEGTAESHVDDLIERLRALPASIAEIETYEVARDAGLADGNADLLVVATFADRAAWEIYRDHPDHQRIIDEQIRPVLARRSAIQNEG